MIRWVYGVDPGTKESAVVIVQMSLDFGMYDPVVSHGTYSNATVLDILHVPAGVRFGNADECILAVEQIESMGLAVGREVFETVWWAGRFHEAWTGRAERITRRQVKLHLCDSMRAKDANIRQALLDRYGGSTAIGKKKTPGPLYGVKGHEFAALAVAVTFIDLVLRREHAPSQRSEETQAS